jgi:hypothetical protein
VCVSGNAKYIFKTEQTEIKFYSLESKFEMVSTEIIKYVNQTETAQERLQWHTFVVMVINPTLSLGTS